MNLPIGDLQAQLEDLLRRDVEYDITREEGIITLDLCDEFAARYVAYRDVDRWANVLWSAHSYLMPCWYYSPRLLFISPESGCGKTRAMTITEHLVPHSKRSDRMTAAAAYLRHRGTAADQRWSADPAARRDGHAVRGRPQR